MQHGLIEPSIHHEWHNLNATYKCCFNHATIDESADMTSAIHIERLWRYDGNPASMDPEILHRDFVVRDIPECFRRGGVEATIACYQDEEYYTQEEAPAHYKY